MKRLVYIIAALVALTSCTISEGWNSDQDYVAKRAYDMVIEQVRNQMHILSYAQVIDIYALAGDGEREIIEDQHLPSTRLRKSDTGWDVVRDGTLRFSFVCDTPISEVGSVWSVIYPAGNEITADQFWTIECTGENRWQLSQAIKYESHNVVIKLDIVAGDQIEGRLENGPIYKYTIEGECTIVQREELSAPYRIDAKIIEPVVFDNYTYYSNFTGTALTEGKMSFRVTDYNSNENVVAPFHFTISPVYSNIKIEYLLTE